MNKQKVNRIFCAGDSVTLKSGSPPMIVRGYIGETDRVVCFWTLDDGIQASDTFPELTLSYYTKDITNMDHDLIGVNHAQG